RLHVDAGRDLPALAEVAGGLRPGALGGAAPAPDGAVEVLGADGAGLHAAEAGERGGAGGGADGSTPWVGSGLRRRRHRRLPANDYSHLTRPSAARSTLPARRGSARHVGSVAASRVADAAAHDASARPLDVRSLTCLACRGIVYSHEGRRWPRETTAARRGVPRRRRCSIRPLRTRPGPAPQRMFARSRPSCGAVPSWPVAPSPRASPC